MKKFLTVIIVTLSMMFTSCYFFKDLEATVKIVNNTDYTFYYMADYNMSLKSGDSVKAKKIEPGKTIVESLQGIFSESALKDSTEYFYFYYCEEDAWKALKDKYSYQNEWFLMTGMPRETGITPLEAKNKNSLDYSIIFTKKDGKNYDIEISW